VKQTKITSFGNCFEQLCLAYNELLQSGLKQASLQIKIIVKYDQFDSTLRYSRLLGVLNDKFVAGLFGLVVYHVHFFLVHVDDMPLP